MRCGLHDRFPLIIFSPAAIAASLSQNFVMRSIKNALTGDVRLQ